MCEIGRARRRIDLFLRRNDERGQVSAALFVRRLMLTVLLG